MLRQSIILLCAFFALSTNANNDLKENPMDQFIIDQIETLDLELELFGTPTKSNIAPVASIQVYELEEEPVLNFDTKQYLPKDFNARKGMHDIDWNTINLYEVEETIDLGFNAKDYLPEDFNPYQGMVTVKSQGICFF